MCWISSRVRWKLAGSAGRGEGAENGVSGAGGGADEEPGADEAKPGPGRNVGGGTGATT